MHYKAACRLSLLTTRLRLDATRSTRAHKALVKATPGAELLPMPPSTSPPSARVAFALALGSLLNAPALRKARAVSDSATKTLDDVLAGTFDFQEIQPPRAALVAAARARQAVLRHARAEARAPRRRAASARRRRRPQVRARLVARALRALRARARGRASARATSPPPGPQRDGLILQKGKAINVASGCQPNVTDSFTFFFRLRNLRGALI